ncbi:MAG: metallophosphoesterase family protein, partial [Pirellulaceae bacterium]
MPMISRIACLGGIYSNHLALEAALRDISRRGVDAIYCLGDLGGFGPYPDRIFPLLEKYQVQCIQGNYDHSIGHGLDDCQCGYTDPQDNYYAQVSYDYTLANTSRQNRDFLRDLPDQLQLPL